MKYFFNFFIGLVKNRKIILSLAASDLQSRNLGSALGFFWIFLNPLLSMLVIWVVFELGIKDNSHSGGSSVAWLIAGLVAWQVISEGISSGASSIIEKPYLVKKIKFDTELLPVIKMINSLKVSLFFICFLILVSLLHGSFVLHSLWQMPYYLFCLAFLLIAAGIASSALVVFYKDFQNIVTFVLQIGFWGTPILWDYHVLDKYHITWILDFHPFHYIVQGIRDSVFGGTAFYVKMGPTLIFWAEVVILLIVARWIFAKLRPGFSDVI